MSKNYLNLVSQKTTIKGLPELNELSIKRLQGNSNQEPKNGLEKEIAKLFLDILQIPEKDFILFRDDNFFELGGKSLQATVMIQILRNKYKLRLSYEQFVRNATIEQLSRAILRVQNKAEKKEIISFYTEQQVSGNAPVFLIHSLLGDAEMDYEKLKSVWNSPRSLYAISARGLKDPEDMDNDLLSIAYDYYLAIKSICPRGPKIIAGWSLGGILAALIKYFFEMDNDCSVEVVMIDSESPTIFQLMSPLEYAKYLHDLFEKKLMGQFSVKTLPLSTEELSILPKEQQIYKLFQAVASNLSGMGIEENKRLLAIVRNLLLGVFKLRLSTIITDVHLITASETQKNRKDKNLCWPSSLVEIKDVETFTGDHHSIIFVQNSAKLIANYLEKVSSTFQNYFMVNMLSAELQSMPIADINEDELRYYIPAKGCRNNNYENSFELFEHITNNYLNSKQNVLLLLGDAGTGKTTFVQFLSKHLKQNLKGSVTLYIQLALYENPTHGLIESHLRRLGLSDIQIKHLKGHQKFFIIIDGYDETDKGQYQNLYATNRLDQWNAQIIIACRSSYLYNAQNHKLLFCPIKKNNPNYSGLNELSIVPFEDSQIENYITKFLNNPPEELEIDEDWQEVQKYLDHIDQLPGLRELIRTPFLLRVLMEVLPQIVSNYENIPFDKRIPLTQSKILDTFVESLWERQTIKLMLNGQLPEDGHDITLDFEKFSVELAKEMKLKDEIRVIYRKGIEPWEKFFGNSDKDLVKAREGAPLKRISGDQKGAQIISFIHDLLIEYFISRGLYQDFLQTQPVESLVEHFSHQPKTSPAMFEQKALQQGKDNSDEEPQKAIKVSLQKELFSEHDKIINSSVTQFKKEKEIKLLKTSGSPIHSHHTISSSFYQETPQTAEDYIRSAIKHKRNSNQAERFWCLKKALTLSESHPAANFQMAQYLFESENYTKALEFIEISLMNEPNKDMKINSYNLCARIYIVMKDYNSAKENIAIALNINSENIETNDLMAIINTAVSLQKSENCNLK